MQATGVRGNGGCPPGAWLRLVWTRPTVGEDLGVGEALLAAHKEVPQFWGVRRTGPARRLRGPCSSSLR